MRLGMRGGVAGGSLVLAIGACGLAGSGGAATASEPLPASAATGSADTAVAVLRDAAGSEAGRVILRETPRQGVLLDIRIDRLTEGQHAVHIHETGACDAPSFQSAGGHYNPHGRAHGAMHADGMHGGDMLNLHVPASGRVRTERIAPHVTLRAGAAHTLFDDDGSAIVIHAAADDYRSQPAGDAGGRVLCGVVRR